jgi:hypothetical protein
VYETRRAASAAALRRIPSLIASLLSRLLSTRGIFALVLIIVSVIGWAAAGRMISEASTHVLRILAIIWPFIAAIILIIIPSSPLRRARRALHLSAAGLLGGTLVLLGVLLILLSVFFLPGYLTSTSHMTGSRNLSASDYLKAQNDVRGTLLQGVAGLILVIGALGTWRQIRIAREGQITERFTRAVDQLGSDKLDIRMGGVYALERIATNSVSDRAAITEILTAYVREHSPWRSVGLSGSKKEWSVRLKNGALFAWSRLRALTRAVTSSRAANELEALQVRVPDVQAVMTVLARIPKGGAKIDLHGSDLRGLTLSYGADLRRADLTGSILSGAELDGCDLRDADLTDAELHKTSLFNAKLGGALIFNADLTESKLAGARFGAGEPVGSLKATTYASLSGSILRRVNLRGSDLRYTTLNDVDLRGSDLQGAILRGAHLEGADLRDATLQRTDYEDADLTDSSADSATLWPNGFDPISAGVKLERDTNEA